MQEGTVPQGSYFSKTAIESRGTIARSHEKKIPLCALFKTRTVPFGPVGVVV